MLILKHLLLFDNRKSLFLNIVGYRTIENVYFKALLVTVQLEMFISNRFWLPDNRKTN